MVELVRAGRDPAELAREFEPTAQSISHWVARALGGQRTPCIPAMSAWLLARPIWTHLPA